ncbi:long-chain-fatty-acid--CoA ligase [Sphingomonas sp. CL5.1]|uniref:fatty acyl-CoA synthetase n=1 Tax=Sphingomonas sp. CL5.1 TaxID=2653203 RepID=UPI001583A4FD|nr:fatty acyl-CoA synthetase [Sphingomonas sp. CL5.1]QKR99888.1 long-chain-fatty-acid--CoA ligase [Sphingomonas sp. CL5.1]
MHVDQARHQSLSTLLRRSAARHGNKPAIICGEISWSYLMFDDIVDALGRGLIDRGIAKGDRVAILARNSHVFAALRFAVARIGAVLVPINFMLTAEEVRYVLDHSGARLLFVDRTTKALGLDARTAAVEAIFGIAGEGIAPPDGIPSWDTLCRPGPIPDEVVSADDLLQIIYTSGTESRPKGAMLTHGAVLWQYQSCVIDCEWSARTVALHALPMFHCAQLDAMLGPALQSGATNIITATASPDNLIPLLSRYKVTSFFSPPTVWIGILRSPLLDDADLSQLACGYYGASIMPVEILRELARRLPALRLWNLYGQTEIAPVATVLFPHEHGDRAGSAGRPTLHVSTRIVDDAMHDVPAGEIGEIVHQSPQLMIGYWNDAKRTAEAFAGGWFHSGDLGVMDADGYITIVDRKKDMIKSGGENVSSREVEEVLYGHPGIAEAAVIGMPDPRWIEAVTAVVVARQGQAITEAEVIDYCRTRLAGFKLPKRVVIAESLPKNASGKVLKRELRALV